MGINYRILIKISGLIMTISGFSLLLAFAVALAYEETEVMDAILVSSLIMLVLGIVFLTAIKPGKEALKLREGYMVVTFCWLSISLLGALPYYLSGYVDNFVDAFFESVSGFTTTGCTLIDPDHFSKGLMTWKAISHWLGGMGILVFVISILPTLGSGGQKIVKAEAPGPRLEKMATRISDSTKLLYLIYVAFTIVQFFLLWAGPMNAYEALINSMGSVSTGGLFTHAEGLDYYDSFYVEAVIATFMILSSINFVLYFYLLNGKWRDFLKDIELRAFLAILAIAVFLVGLGLYFYGTYDSPFHAFRHAFFQVVSFATTTGYAICDYTTWPSFCLMILMLVMIIGGCAASTCGALKVIRVLVFFKLIGRGIYKRIHPRAVVAVKLGGKTLPAPMVSQITVFILVYFAVYLLTTLVLSLQNLDMTTTLSLSLSLLSNTGIFLGEYGAAGYFGMFSPPLKIFISFIMIAGRLELFTILLMFTPSFWNADR